MLSKQSYEPKDYDFDDHDDFHNIKQSPDHRQQKGKECTHHIALRTHPTLVAWCLATQLGHGFMKLS